MNIDGGQQNFSIRLLNEQLRRDAQTSMRQFDNIGRSATTAGTSVDRSMNSISKSVNGAIRGMANSISTAMQEMAKNMVGITALLSSGAFLKSLYDESKAFNREMKVVSTISEDVAMNLERYKQQVLQLCTQLAIAPDTAAQALYQINSAGHLGADGMKVLEASAKAAIGGVTETATAADAITTILNAYKMSANQAEAISDKLFTTVRLGKTTMGELGAHISAVAPLAARYKISIDEILAATAQLTKQGNNTASAMTQISASIIAVANELGDDAFKDGLMAGLDEIEKRANGSNMALKAQLSNIRAVRGAMGLTGESAKETAEMIEQIRNSAGATADACEKMNSTASAEVRKLKTNFLNELSELGDGMSKTVASLAKTLNAAFESGEMSKILGLLKDLIITYGIYKALIVTVTVLNKAYKNVMSQVAYQKALAATQQKALNTQQALGAVITTNLKRAVMGLNAALKANAFGLIISVIAAAAYAIYKFCNRVSEAEKVQKRLTEATAKMTQEVGDERRKVMELLNTLKTAKKETDEYKKAKQQIIDQYGTHLGKIINEKGEITNLAEAYRILASEINATARAKAMEELNQEAAEDFTDKNKKTVEALKQRLRGQRVSESDIELAVNRVMTSIATTGALPEGIDEQYGVSANFVEDILRDYIVKMGNGTPETQKKAQKAVEEWRNISSGRTWSERDVYKVLGNAGYGKADDIKRVNVLLAHRSGTQMLMDELVKNNQTYQDQLRQNSLYTGLFTPEASMFAGISDENFGSDLSYLKKTVLPKLINGEYGNGGVRMNFKGGKQQLFKTEEELRQFIQLMELELQNRQAAASLGTGGEGGSGSETKTIAEQVAEMITQSRTETNADKLKQLKEKMKDMLDGGQIDITSSEYSNLRAAYNTLKQRFPGSGDGSSSDTPEQLQAAVSAAHQAELDLIDSQKREMVRAEKDAEFQVTQARIDAMEDGAEKLLAQRELDYQKQEEEMQREMEDAILNEIERQKALFDAQENTAEAEAKQRGNKNYVKRTFNSGGLMATSTVGDDGTITANYTAGQLLAEGTIGNVDTSVINEILRRYKKLFGDMQTAHNETWRKTEEDAMNEYLAQWGQGLEKRNAIIAIATRKMAQAETEGERKSIFAQLQKDLSDLDIEANKKTAAISRLFDDMTDTTVADMKKIYAQAQKSLSFLTGGEWNAETGLELGISKETFDVLSKSPEELDRIRKAIRALKGEIDGVEGGFKKLATGLKEVFKTGGDTKKFQQALGKIAEGMQTVQQVAGFLQNSLSQLGEAFGSDVFGDIANGIGVAMDAMDSAMQGANTGFVLGGPWGAAAGAAIGLVSSLGSAFTKLHNAKHEKKIQELQKQIETLKEDYDRLGNAVEKAYSKDAKKMIEQQNTLLRQQQQLIRNQIAEEKAKKGTDWDKIADWEKQIRDIEEVISDNKEKAIDAIFGEDVKAAIDRFSDAYASMFDGGTTRAKASKDLVKQMIKNMIVEAMKADISEPMEKLRQMMLGFWSDEKITDWEKNSLEDYVNNMLAEEEKKWGWADGYFKESTSQDSSKGGFTTMSQDSADELNGRFTALQMAGEQIKSSTADINEQLKGIAARNMATASAVEEIRGLQLIAVDHLETIRKHTANLADIKERLGKIEKYTSRI